MNSKTITLGGNQVIEISTRVTSINHSNYKERAREWVYREILSSIPGSMRDDSMLMYNVNRLSGNIIPVIVYVEVESRNLSLEPAPRDFNAATVKSNTVKKKTKVKSASKRGKKLLLV